MPSRAPALPCAALQRGERKSKCRGKHVAAVQSKPSSTKRSMQKKLSMREDMNLRIYSPLDFPGSS